MKRLDKHDKIFIGVMVVTLTAIIAMIYILSVYGDEPATNEGTTPHVVTCTPIITGKSVSTICY